MNELIATSKFQRKQESIGNQIQTINRDQLLSLFNQNVDKSKLGILFNTVDS